MRCSSLTMLAFGALASAMPYPYQDHSPPSTAAGSIRGTSHTTANTFRPPSSPKSKRQFEFGSLIDYWSQKAQAEAHGKPGPPIPSNPTKREAAAADPHAHIVELSWAPIQARHIRKRESAAAGYPVSAPADTYGHTTSSLLKSRHPVPIPPPIEDPFASNSALEHKQHPELTWAPIQARSLRMKAKRATPEVPRAQPQAPASLSGLDFATRMRPTSSVAATSKSPAVSVKGAQRGHRRSQAVDLSSAARGVGPVSGKAAKEDAATLAELRNKRWEEVGDVMKAKRRDWRLKGRNGNLIEV